jgi:hypothetical protein
MYNPVHMSFMTIARRDVKVCQVVVLVFSTIDAPLFW